MAVVNSADYGFPQRRKRVFILAEHNASWGEDKAVLEGRVFARAFPYALEGLEIIDLGRRPFGRTDSFNAQRDTPTPHNCGVMVDRSVLTGKCESDYREGFDTGDTTDPRKGS